MMKCCSRSMQTMSGLRVRLTRSTMTRNAERFAQTVEVAVQLRRRAEEEFALQVQEHHPRAARIGRLAIADDAVRADGQLGGLQAGRHAERTSGSTGRRR